MTQTVLANAELVLETEVVRGSVAFRDGVIAAVDQGSAAPPGALDCGGDYLCPGLIELHTDNIERHMRPRPGVTWPAEAAVPANDAELASVGITTVFDALRVGSIPRGTPAEYGKYARETADHTLDHRAKGHLKISHFLHLRAEICSETLVEELAEFTESDRIGIVSLMDHTPGRRQFRDLAKLETYLRGKYGMTGADLEAHYARLRDIRERFGARNEAEAVRRGKALGAALASHDDTTADDVAASAAHGVRMAEFPTTPEAAEACRRHGIAVIAGAPNLLRGGSHFGNAAAAELAERGLLDILSSDYAPSALLSAAVKLGLESGDMAGGVATVTRAPARAAGLNDRGVLKPGARADFTRFHIAGSLPIIRRVWSRGRPV